MKQNRNKTAALLVAALIFIVGACASGPPSAYDDYAPPPQERSRTATQPESAQAYPPPSPAPAEDVAELAYVTDSDAGGTYASYRAEAPAEAEPPPEPPPEATPPEIETPERPAQLLIYSGAIVLAIYDVRQTQQEAIALIEEMGGYVSERSSRSLTARVPAAKFRDAMDELGALGDLLDESWKAQDVTEQVRDLDIRLRNSLELRNRLEILLEEAESIEEALQIESELERITLEIERIRGTLQSLEDRISYSTIELTFDAIQIDDVPDDEFLLPFSWLYQLGLESLLRAPEAYR